MQFHSVPVSEPTAFISGILTGVVGYFAARTMQLDSANSLVVANAVAAITTLVVGGSINLTLLDLLGGVIFRPLTAIGTPILLDRLIS